MSNTKRWLLAAAVVIGIAAAAGAGYVGYTQATVRNAALGKLSDATGLLEEADRTVIAVDEIVRGEIDENTSADAGEARSDLEIAVKRLTEATGLVDEARPDLPEDQLARADAIVASASARLDMLAEADEILGANVAASEALSPASTGWDLVLEAEKLSDEAVKEYNRLTKDAVRKSQDLSAQAEAKMKEARASFDVAEKAFSAAVFEVYIAYIDEKIALIGISKQADAAFIAGENAKANEFSNQYNAKDKQVVELAKKLPESTSAAVAEAYEREAGPATERYMQAREEATAADDELRALDE